MQTTANQQTAGSRIQPSHQNQHTTNDALQTTGKNKPTATTAAITTTTTTAAAVGSMVEIDYVSHFHETTVSITSIRRQQTAEQQTTTNMRKSADSKQQTPSRIMGSYRNPSTDHKLTTTNNKQ